MIWLRIENMKMAAIKAREDESIPTHLERIHPAKARQQRIAAIPMIIDKESGLWNALVRAAFWVGDCIAMNVHPMAQIRKQSTATSVARYVKLATVDLLLEENNALMNVKANPARMVAIRAR